MEDIYDITSIPEFPYEVGMTEWLVLLAVAIAALLLVINIGKRRRSAALDPVDLVMTELKVVTAKEHITKTELARIMLLVKRLLGSKLNMPFAEMAPDEARRILLSLNNEHESLANLMADLDNLKYTPSEESVPSERIRNLQDLLSNFCTALR